MPLPKINVISITHFRERVYPPPFFEVHIVAAQYLANDRVRKTRTLIAVAVWLVAKCAMRALLRYGPNACAQIRFRGWSSRSRESANRHQFP